MWLHIFFLHHKIIGALQSLDRFSRSFCLNSELARAIDRLNIFEHRKLDTMQTILHTSIKTALRFTFFRLSFGGPFGTWRQLSLKCLLRVE